MNKYLTISNYYTLHRDEIVQFITMRIADACEAEDMVQDIFLRLLRGYQLITPQTLPDLVYTTARNSIVDFFRHRRIYEEYEHYLKGCNATDEVESIISANQLIERMEHSLARLPKTCVQVYRLHIYEGLKVCDIAKELTLPYKQVEKQLGQARKHVRQQLRKCI